MHSDSVAYWQEFSSLSSSLLERTTVQWLKYAQFNSENSAALVCVWFLPSSPSSIVAPKSIKNCQLRVYIFTLSSSLNHLLVFSRSKKVTNSIQLLTYFFFLCPSWQPTRVCSALDTFEKSTPLTSLSMREDLSITRSMGEVILLFPS